VWPPSSLELGVHQRGCSGGGALAGGAPAAHRRIDGEVGGSDGDKAGVPQGEGAPSLVLPLFPWKEEAVEMEARTPRTQARAPRCPRKMAPVMSTATVPAAATRPVQAPLRRKRVSRTVTDALCRTNRAPPCRCGPPEQPANEAGI